MTNSNTECESLASLSLTKLCNSIDKDGLQSILESCPSSIIFQVVWQLLQVNNHDRSYEYNYKNVDGELAAVSRGRLLAKPPENFFIDNHSVSLGIINNCTHDLLNDIHQTIFKDKLDFCVYFTHNVFLKLVDNTAYRNQLFIIFQICVQRFGYMFPKLFIAKYLVDSRMENRSTSYYVENGLKIGNFLGDSGWFTESSAVLSHTFKVISIDWVCLDDNLKFTKTIECLTKWLLVLSNSHDFVEGKRVLFTMLHTINIIEKMEERTVCLAHAYTAVSQFFYGLMEFNESWAWTVKAVNELSESSDEVLRLVVVSHAVKVCSVVNKLDIAKKLIDQLHTYNKVIEEHIYVDMLINEACYLLKADLAKDSIKNYYIALDSRRNLFGFNNLYTAIMFVEYAYVRYVCDYSATDYNDAMYGVLLGISIMRRINIPEDNFLLVNAGRIKALILEEKSLMIDHRGIIGFVPSTHGFRRRKLRAIKKEMLKEAEKLHLKALDISKNLIGEKSLLTAKAYCNLGRLYQTQQRHLICEEMHLKAIQIKEAILGKDDPEVALSLGHLASLYTYHLKKYTEAEQLYLRSQQIYETTHGQQYSGLLYDFQGLAEIYYETNNIDQLNYYANKLQNFHATREEWLDMVHTATNVNCKKNDLSVEKFKCLLNESDSGCEK